MFIENKIRQEFSAPNLSHQNGTAEQMWRTIFEMARCLLIEANYAARVAAYIRNRCYGPRIDKTPFEMVTSKKPNLENMHLFGSRCYAYIEDKRKLDPRCDKGSLYLLVMILQVLLI